MARDGREAPASKQAILIIDDEEVVRFLFQNLLEEEGYTALLAETGQQGIEMLSQHAPAVVLVDKNLPDLSGLELIASQKKSHPDTEFIMITGYASLDSAVKAMEVGAFSYLTKPFEDMNIVMDRIRAALEVNNLRVETSVLRERLSSIAGAAERKALAPRSAGAEPATLAHQVRQTISLLESFLQKRTQPPTPATWARLVDMLEQEARKLRQALGETKPR